MHRQTPYSLLVAQLLRCSAQQLSCSAGSAQQQTHCRGLTGRRMSDAVSPVDGMDWGAGGVEEGTEEAADVKIALINAVLTQDGAGAANEGESEASRLWRCGTLRSTEPDAAPVLRRAIAVSDAR